MVCQHLLSGCGFDLLKVVKIRHYDSCESLIIMSKITLIRAAVAVLCIGIWSLYISISRAFYTKLYLLPCPYDKCMHMPSCVSMFSKLYPAIILFAIFVPFCYLN